MPGTRLPTAELLRSIINLLARVAGRLPASSPAALVRVDRLPTRPEEEVELSLRPLPAGLHPLAMLDGFVAPPTWAGIGIVAAGRVTSVGEPGGSGRGRVILVLLRDGTLASGLETDDGSLHVDVGPAGAGAVGGLPLALCRALGVPCTVAAEPGATQGDSG